MKNASQQVVFAGNSQRLVHDLDRIRILGTQVDVTLRGPNPEARDHHALDQAEGIAFHDHPVREGAAVALVGIADDVLLRRLGKPHRVPLDAGREACAAPSPQTGVGDMGCDILGAHRQRVAQASQSAVRLVLRQRQRVDDTAALERQPVLFRVKRDLFHDAKALRAALHDRGDVIYRDCAVADTLSVPLDLYKRFQPDHAARTVAHNLGTGGGEGGRNIIRAKRLCGCITGYIDLHRATSAASVSAVTRPLTLPSIIAAGPQAQRPRQ
mmetsp:Transcript_571/g.897  ORF Transcript_571/g.897 Transcript_571/m.897 type:complete len:269 (-) Transcript_571:900-1706(-)